MNDFLEALAGRCVDYCAAPAGSDACSRCGCLIASRRVNPLAALALAQDVATTEVARLDYNAGVRRLTPHLPALLFLRWRIANGQLTPGA